MSAGEDPVAWLRAQVEARKTVAEEALLGFPLTPCVPDPEIPGERWYASYHEVTQRRPWTDREAVRPRAVPVADCGAANVYPARHIALNDPQDTIARCEAELAILDEYDAAKARRAAEADDYAVWVRGRAPAGRPVFDGPERGLIAGLECAVRLLASGYRHRPGYEAAGWKP